MRERLTPRLARTNGEVGLVSTRNNNNSIDVALDFGFLPLFAFSCQLKPLGPLRNSQPTQASSVSVNFLDDSIASPFSRCPDELLTELTNYFFVDFRLRCSLALAADPPIGAHYPAMSDSDSILLSIIASVAPPLRPSIIHSIVNSMTLDLVNSVSGILQCFVDAF